MERFEIIKGYPSNSASDTDIWEARDKITGKRCVFKVFIHKYQIETKKRKKTVINPHSDLLEHEIQIYTYLKNKLIYPKNVRNILCLLDTFEFSKEELVTALQNPKLKLAKDTIVGNMMRNFKYLVLAVTDVSEPRYSITGNFPFSQKDYIQYERDLSKKNISYKTVQFKYECLVTPKISGPTFSNLVLKGLKLTQFMNYICILLYTLKELADVGINQNDLHWKNIIMDNTYFGPTTYHKKNYFFVVKDTVFYVDNPYVPFIYDFDRSALKGKMLKSISGNLAYSKSGNCPKFHPKRDFMKMLCSIYYHLNTTTTFVTHNQAYADSVLKGLTDLFKTQYIRDAMAQSLTMQDNDCKMSNDRKTGSVLCEKNVFQDIAPVDEILEWALNHVTYKRFGWNEISRPSSRMIEIIKNFKEDIPEGLTVKEETFYTTTNVQFVGAPRDLDALVNVVINTPRSSRDSGCIIF